MKEAASVLDPARCWYYPALEAGTWAWPVKEGEEEEEELLAEAKQGSSSNSYTAPARSEVGLWVG